MGVCGGYQITHQHNPLAQYGISSVAVPMFFNQSALPNAAVPFTSEFYRWLTSYRGLKVYSGFEPKADAVLLGVVSSPQKLGETVRVEGRKRVQTLVDPGDIGRRQDFFTPTRNSLLLTLRVVLIKNPNRQEVQFFQREIARVVEQHPKLIFNKTVSLSTSFSREFRSRSQGEGGVSNFTNNLGALQEAVRTLAASGRQHFQEVVVNVF